ncbi:MAG TPA: hypothetical protein DCZ95_17940 [Verrucomicrobia bacterium]|nr:MAG: hypothetical protein A2X46_10715 [Lentisphaerae bacterium GWF2_57_35]HBA85969.1 hypothetical protein [Verrucomicrobiota bacterium]
MTQHDQQIETQPALSVTPEQLAALIRGDEQAWDSFFFLVRPVVMRVAYWPRWHFDQTTRSEVAQQILAELPVSLKTYKGTCSVFAFIRRIAVYKCVDEVRRQIKERKTIVSLKNQDEGHTEGSPIEEISDGRKEFNPVQVILHAELSRTIEEVIQSLGEGCAKLLTWFYFDQFSYKELAAKMGISINTVSPRLSKCYKKMRRRIEENPVLGNYFGRVDDFAGRGTESER